jgi:aldose 1-epimerase
MGMGTKQFAEQHISAKDFDITINGKAIQLFTLLNDQLAVTITNYGARLVHMVTPDQQGQMVDVLTGPATIHDFLNADNPYYGAIIGRYANRIANGKFSLNNKTFQLEQNVGINHLHGGSGGFHTKVWEVLESSSQSLQLQYTSPDGEEGYPGSLVTTITFKVVLNSLHIQYKAESDQATILNLTHHPFFNLNGCANGTVYKHKLSIDADRFLPVTEQVIPTGEMASVEETVFDFRKPESVGKRLFEADVQLQRSNGYDHCFVLNAKIEQLLVPAAVAVGDISGIEIKLFTTEPGLQLYTGNFMSGKNKMKYNATDKKHTAFCLEAQHFPDSPNQTNFPSVILNAGESYLSTIIYQFQS